MTDYTKFSTGKKVFEGIPDIDIETGEDVGEVRGIIELCPHCNRNGLVPASPGGGKIYVHWEGVISQEGGKFVLGWESCPISSPPASD